MPYINNRVVSQAFYDTYMKGPPGDRGIQGSVGPQGVTGLQGSSGGETGGSGGSTGPQGVTGLHGVTGTRGLPGLQGYDGDKGETGAQGLQGSGSQGETGLCGATGIAGLTMLPGVAAITAQVSVANTTTETTIIQATVPAANLAVGTCFRFKFMGTHQHQATSGTLTFRMYINGTAGQTVALASQGTARAQIYCDFEGYATIRSTGSGGTYITTGIYRYLTSTTAQLNSYQGNADTTAVNTTADVVVRLTAQWATASTTNILLVQNAFIEQIRI